MLKLYRRHRNRSRHYAHTDCYSHSPSLWHLLSCTASVKTSSCSLSVWSGLPWTLATTATIGRLVIAALSRSLPPSCSLHVLSLTGASRLVYRVHVVFLASAPCEWRCTGSPRLFSVAAAPTSTNAPPLFRRSVSLRLFNGWLTRTVAHSPLLSLSLSPPLPTARTDYLPVQPFPIEVYRHYYYWQSSYLYYYYYY